MHRLKRLMDSLAFLFIAGIVVVAIFYLCVPIIVSIAMSFDARRYVGQFPPPALSLQWYVQFFTNPYYLAGLKTSLTLAAVSTTISTAIGVCGALVVHSYASHGRALLSTLFLSPLIIPAVVLGLGLLMFFSMIDVYEPFVRLLGGHIMIGVPYTFRTTLAGLGGIRKSIIEAAQTLGASEFRAFWDITFPLAKTGIIAGSVFSFAFSLDDVAVSMFLAGPDSYTLPVALISMMRANFDLTIAAAGVIFVVFTILLIVALDCVVGLDRLVGQGVYRA